MTGREGEKVQSQLHNSQRVILAHPLTSVLRQTLTNSLHTLSLAAGSETVIGAGGQLTPLTTPPLPTLTHSLLAAVTPPQTLIGARVVQPVGDIEASPLFPGVGEEVEEETGTGTLQDNLPRLVVWNEDRVRVVTRGGTGGVGFISIQHGNGSDVSIRV
jgi:hypothetical protein